MKKSILFLAIGFIALNASAQTVKEADVPLGIKASFVKLYPTAKADKWEKEGNNYEAEFTASKVETSVLFGPNGQLLETENEITPASLPKAVAEYVAKNVPGKKIKEASKITDASGKVTYEAEVNEVDYIFDADGAFIKKEVEAPDADGDKK